MNPTVAGLTIHPVKSCRGLPLTTLEVGRRGPVGDRRWLVVDAAGRFVTARERPRLVLLEAVERDGRLHLAAPGQPPIAVAVPGPAAPTRAIRIWKDDTTAGDAGDEAAAWLSGFLGHPVRLVHQRAGDRRSIELRPGGQPGDEVSFADGYPLLLIGTASLAALNERLREPVSMARFRPNVLAETTEPFEEDGWREVAIGDVPFAVGRRCARCVLTTVDPATGVASPDREPLATLKTFRYDPSERGILFGVNLIPRGTGRIALGMPIRAGRAPATG